MTGKHAVLEALRAEGVEYIFGNPGTSETPIMDALESYPDLKYVLTVQEGVAMGMADAYGRATGSPSFVNLHIETGLANGISLLNNAYQGGSPIVLTAANKDMRELARGRTDLAAMVTQFTKWSVEVTHPDAIPSAMRRAFHEAKTPPTGPTFVAFSADSLDGEGDVEIMASPTGYTQTRPDRDAIEDAVRILASASNPIVLVGDSVGESGAVSEAVRVAETLGARVYSSSYAAMNFPSSHPQYLGGLRLGFPAADETLSSADAVLVAGKLNAGHFMFSSPTMQFLSPETALVHVDADASNVGRTEATDVGIVADPRVALAELADALESEMSGSAREAAKGRAATAASQKQAEEATWQRHVEERWDTTPMSPERMMTEVAKGLPEDVIIANDSVTTGSSLLASIAFDEPGSLYGGRGGALGWGMGGALGVKLANPDRPVVAVVGDGSAMMTVQALWTAASERIPVVYVICNNGTYRVLKVNMKTYKDLVLKGESPASKYIGMDFGVPFDMAGMANANGVHGRRIEDPAELEPALREAIERNEPALLDVVIDGSV